MDWSASQIADIVSGSIHGDPNIRVRRLQALKDAQAGDLSFFAPTSTRNHAEMLQVAKKSAASVLLVREVLADVTTTQVVVENPLAAMAVIAKQVHPKPTPEVGVHPQAVVHPSAKLGRDVRVGAFACIGANVEIGDRTVIFPHVVIYAGVRVGSDCILHSGAVLREEVVLGSDCVVQNGAVVGGDGFGYQYIDGKGHQRIPHVGTVVLEDGVDLGANTTIDRATLGETRIGAGTKIDNLVMVGHNTQIGRAALLCGQVGVSGSSHIGNGAILGGKVGVSDHITIGDRARVAAGSGVITNIEPSNDVAGYPAQKASSWRRQQVVLARLPELMRKLVKLVGE